MSATAVLPGSVRDEASGRTLYNDEAAEPPLRYQRMSLAEYERLPESELKVEWAHGWAIFMNAPTWDHSRILINIGAVLKSELPDLKVGAGPGLGLIDSRRIPDIAVFESPVPSDPSWIEQAPLIAVEILSPSTRRQDLVYKRAEYLDAGIAQYWIVDPQSRQITVLADAGGAWIEAAVVDEQHPATDVIVGTHGIVHLDLNDLFN